MNQALHPTIAASLAPFMGSMGTFSNNPVADAEAHNDQQADTFDWEVRYMGLDMIVTINKHTLRAHEIYTEEEGCIYYELSDKARDNIAKIAIRESGL